MPDAIAVTERAIPTLPAGSGRRPVSTLAMVAAPVLVGLVPIVWLWSSNRGEFEPGVMVGPAVVVTIATLVLVAIWRVIAGSLAAASLLASISLLAIFAYGTELDLVAAVTGRTSDRVALAVRVADLVLFGVVAIVVVVLARRGRDAGRVARGIGTVAAIVLVLAVVRPFGTATAVSLGLDGAGPGLDDGGTAGDGTGDGDPASAPDPDAAGGGSGIVGDTAPIARVVPIRASDDAAHPDVYYVILDGYARADTLARHYGFDNGPFLAALAERGFYLADRSHANYPYTYLSLASSLNGRHLSTEIAAGIPYRDYLPLIREATVPAAFRARGYAYDLVSSVWAGTTGSPLADERFGPTSTFANEFEAAVVEGTIFRGLLPAPTVADYHLAAFASLESIGADPRPTFAFAHLVMPHPPYVLDRHGTVVLEQSTVRGAWGGAANERGYLEQLRFANDRILAAIDTILARSTTRPIIVLQGDHGTWSSRFDPAATPHEVATERMSILNAYLVPDAVRAELSPSISPVNTFRAIDRALFGGSEPLLSDDSWYGDGGPPSNLVPYVPPSAP